MDLLIENIEGDHISDMKTIKDHLLDNYGEDFVISTIKQSYPYVLQEHWV